MKFTSAAGRFFALAVSLSFWFAAPAAMAQGRPALIGSAGGEVTASENPGPTLRLRQVTPNLSALSQVRGGLRARPGVPLPVDIRFFDDHTITVNLDEVEELDNDVSNFFGRVEGDPLGRAVITNSRGVMAATVFTGGKTYQVRQRGENYVAREINTARLRESADDMARPLPAAMFDAPPTVAADSAAFIDVIVLYTTKTRIAAGGVAAVESEINNGIAVTNSAYANTGVTQRVRLVHTAEINYTADTATVNIGNVIQALQPALGTAPTGVFAGIPALRNTYGGDILSLWIEGDGNGGRTNGGCGVGYFMDPAGPSFAPFAVNVLIRELCAVDNQSFPHELGHNMGLDHDIFVSSGSVSKPYARGYVDVAHLFRTIMAYDDACDPLDCTRINGFSSPLFTYLGNDVGTLVADSSRALNENALIVANFKTSVVGPGTLQVRATTQSVSEAVGTAQIPVSRAGGSLGAVSVDYTIANGSAIAGTDYTTSTGTLNWANGDVADKLIPVPIIQNAVLSAPRNFFVSVSNAGGGATLGANTMTIVNITDDEQAFVFANALTTVTEGAAASTNLAVNRTGASVGAVSVTWTTSNASAVAGGDFGTVGNVTQRTGVLNWANGDSAPKNITVGPAAANIPIINDTIIEADKNFLVMLSNPIGGPTVGPADTNVVTITDNDSSIAFDVTTAQVSETGPNITVTLTRTGATNVAQAVTFTTTPGTAAATSDYTTTTGSVVFAIGQTSKVITIGPTVVAAPFVRVMNDATIEGPETFNITISAPTAGATLGTNKVLVVTISSDENGVSMATAARGAPITESSGVINIVANRSGSIGAVNVNYAFTNGTAQNGVHYNGTPGSLHWDDGETGPKNIPVTLVDNSLINTARAFTVTLSGATGATLVAPMSTVVTVADDDNTVQFSVATAVVAENTPNLMLTVTRTGISTGAADVTWTAHNGTAIAGTDFGAFGNATEPTGTLHWNALEMASKSVAVPIINNATASGARTFTVQLSGPAGPNVNIGTNSVVNVTLNDDEKSVRFDATAYVIQELPTNPSVAVKLKRGGPATTAISATWTTVNGNAISGTDFGILNNAAARTGTVTWAVNDSADKTILIPILNNAIGGQPPRLFNVVVTPGAGVVLVGGNTATVTINDDDIPPQTSVQFAQPKFVVLENVGNAVLTLTRTDLGPGCALPSQVNYATQPGTALATSDYTTKTGTILWSALDGCVDKQITIAIVNNAVAESPESFKVVLSAPNPGTNLGATPEASVLILDDDEAFPLDGAMPLGFGTPAASTMGWHVSNDPGAYEGVFALKSDEIDDGETAGLEMTGTFAAGSVSFRVKISTEPTFDTLTFFVDGVPQTTWSGVTNTGWQMSPSYPIGAGVHTLRWVYTKDGSVSAGLDAVYLDALVTPTFTP